GLLRRGRTARRVPSRARPRAALAPPRRLPRRSRAADRDQRTRRRRPRRRRRGDGGLRGPSCVRVRRRPGRRGPRGLERAGRARPGALAVRRGVRGARRAAPATRRGSVLRVSKSDLPPPLPPETRTVGQLVAETLKLYGDNLW